MAPWTLKRKSARVVLLNDLDQIFLINSVDPADSSKGSWWELPGGGIDPGERSEDTVMRELWEEGGLREAEVGPVIWTQHVEFDFGGYHFDQDEVIHIARTTERTIERPQGLEALEALAFQGARWWPVPEVVSSTESFLPPSLPTMLPALLDGRLPSPPLDISPDGRVGP
ncbi:MAG: NUDIX domain-containing protein [Acidimicrobiia bacterium]|nr:NUDIX domain-containing protein [Acidimicrobiia bacterium]